MPRALDRMRRRARCALALAVLVGIFLVAAAGLSGAQSTATRSGDTSPVNLATPIDLSAGSAHPSAIVHVGPVRVEVLSSSLLRLEYSPSQHFENDPTVNALDRRMPVPHYSFSTSGGWLTVRTASSTLRYKLGSGPFTPRNTSLRLSVGGRTSTVAPTWDWECTFGQVCQAGAATLRGGAALSQTFAGYQSTAGYAGFFVKPGASVSWRVLGTTAGLIDGPLLSVREFIDHVAHQTARLAELAVDGTEGYPITLTFELKLDVEDEATGRNNRAWEKLRGELT